MITALLLLTGAGVFGYSHLDHKIDNSRTEYRQNYIELRSAENETRHIVNKHEKALQTLGPTATWMEELK